MSRVSAGALERIRKRRARRFASSLIPSTRALLELEGESDDEYSELELACATKAVGESIGKKLEERRVELPCQYVPHAKQRALHSLRTWKRKADSAGRPRVGWRYRVAVCGRRAGKTYGGAADFVAAIFADWINKHLGKRRFEAWGPAPEWRPDRDRDARPFLYYWVVAPTHSLLEEPKTCLHTLLGGFVKDGGVIVHKDHSRGVWWLVGGIRIDFKSAERPELLVGRGIHGVWLDEASRLKPKVWLENLPPVLSDFRGWALFTSTPQGRNWLWELWCKGDPQEAEALAADRGCKTRDILSAHWASIRWGSVDNDRVPGLVEEVELAKGVMPEAMWLRNYAASFHAFLGQCFSNLLTRIHLRPDRVWAPHLASKVLWGFDWGWTHKGSLSVVVRDRFGKYHEVETISRSGILPHHDGGGESWTKHAQALKRKWRITAPLQVSPERPEVQVYFERAGIRAQTAFGGNAEGLDWLRVATYGDEPDLDFATGSVYRSFEGLRHPDSGPRLELWVKEADDEFDSVRYALSDPISRGSVRSLERVTPLTNPLRR